MLPVSKGRSLYSPMACSDGIPKRSTPNAIYQRRSLYLSIDVRYLLPTSWFFVHLFPPPLSACLCVSFSVFFLFQAKRWKRSMELSSQ